jgi:hypothetical protein
VQESRPAHIISADLADARGKYLFTVRGETRILSFNSNSLAMRSSPQRAASIEESRQQSQKNPRGRIDPSRLHAALDVERKLPT